MSCFSVKQLHEAEVLSVRQQKKIKALEGKLQEAKNIVTELREEIVIVCNELERIKKGEDAKSLYNIRPNSVSHGSEHGEESRNTKPDASANILESRSNTKFGPKSTLDVNSLALAIGRYESQSQSLKSRSTALMTPRDIPYLPSILKRTKVPSIYGNKFSRGIHAIIGNKSGGTFCSTNEIAASEKNTSADSMIFDSPFEKNDSGSGGKTTQSELTTCETGSNHNDPDKPIHEERRRYVKNANTYSPLYEHLPSRGLSCHEPTGQCLSKSAVNGNSSSEGNVKCSKREAQKAIETSRLAKTCNLKTLPGYVQEKENNGILIKPCSSKNTSGNDKKEANIPIEGVEAVPSASAKIGVNDLAFDIVPFNSNAGQDYVKYTKNSFQFTKNNIIHYSRKRSRQAKDNTNSNCEAEASPEPVYLKRKVSERLFDILPDLNYQVSGPQSSINQDSQSIAQVAHQVVTCSF